MTPGLLLFLVAVASFCNLAIARAPLIRHSRERAGLEGQYIIVLDEEFDQKELRNLFLDAEDGTGLFRGARLRNCRQEEQEDQGDTQQENGSEIASRPGNGNGQQPGNGNGQGPGNGNGQHPGNGNGQGPGNGQGRPGRGNKRKRNRARLAERRNKRQRCPGRVEMKRFRAVMMENLSEAAVGEIRDHPAVKFVEENSVVYLETANWVDEEDPVSWGLDLVDSEDYPDLMDGVFHVDTEGGDGVNVYIVDSGVDIDNPAFQGRAFHGEMVCGSSGCTVQDDELGHGTAVAGIVASKIHGVARKAHIISVKMTKNGRTTVLEMAAALQWAKENIESRREQNNEEGVINISAGEDFSPTLNGVAASIVSAGIVVVASAGNKYIDACRHSPSMADGVLSVGSVSKMEESSAVKMSSISNWGSCVTLFAPGHDITTLKREVANGNYTATGTSLSAPHVSGAAAALLAEHPGLSPQQMPCTPDEPLPPPTINTSCGAAVLLTSAAPTAVLTTPNYPENYPTLTQCDWTIQTDPSTEHLTLYFEDFQLEDAEECVWDWVEVYRGLNDTGDPLTVVCGPDLPLPVISNSSLLVRFRSDADGVFRGFSARLSVGVPCEVNPCLNGGQCVLNDTLQDGYLCHCTPDYTGALCEDDLTHCGHTDLVAAPTPARLTSHSTYGEANYPNGLHCRWTIRSNTSRPLVITFKAFHIYYNHELLLDCHKDTYDGDKAVMYATTDVSKYDQNYLGTFCQSPGSFDRLDSGQFTLIFTTNRYITDKGFELEYKEYVEPPPKTTTEAPTSSSSSFVLEELSKSTAKLFPSTVL